MREWFGKILILMLALLAPIKPVIIAVGVLTIADMITGMWTAYKRKEPITSAGLRRTVNKLLIFQLCIITGFIVEQYLIEGLIPITKILGGMIGMVELKSILENSNLIMGTDLFKLLITRLGSQNDIKAIAEEITSDTTADKK